MFERDGVNVDHPVAAMCAWPDVVACHNPVVAVVHLHPRPGRHEVVVGDGNWRGGFRTQQHLFHP